MRLVLIVVLLLLATPAQAQDAADLPASTPSGGATVGVEQRQPYWKGSGKNRWFGAANFDAGVVNFRPMFALGYGKPHYRWTGLELGGNVSLSGIRYYSGISGVLPGISLRVGASYQNATQQHYLQPQDTYKREELETELTGKQTYVSGEAELTASWPMPGGSMLAVLSGYAIGEVPDPFYIFEQSLKLVVAPPWLWRGRLGYLFHIGWAGSMKFGAAAEVLHVPNREAIIVRAGPIVSVALTHHLEVSGAAMIVAASPDNLGIVGADLGQLGIRYRWATGDRWAEFP